jgi:hypothetical protein
MGLLFPQRPNPPRPPRKRGVLCEHREKEEGGPSLRRKRTEPQGEFARADHFIETLFATLQCAWRSHNRQLERRTWARLMMRLRELPPPRQ